MKRLLRITATGNASLVLFGVAAVLVLATVVLSIVPPPPPKANTGALILLVWAFFIAIFGLALRSGKRPLQIATAVVAVPVGLINLPFGIGSMPTWADYVANGLGLLVAVASAFACASAVVAVWSTYRPAKKLSIG